MVDSVAGDESSGPDGARAITVGELVERAVAASGGPLSLQRRLGASRAAMEHMSASRRVLGPAEARDLAQALGLDPDDPLLP